MLGLVAFVLTSLMIYTLVKNALVGIQLNAHDEYTGTIELIIPITSHSEFYLEPWLKNLSSFNSFGGHLKIHILVDGHHPSANAWQVLHEQLPFIEIHSFLLRPLGREAVPWMLEQIAPQIKGDVVIIGDPELVPTVHAFKSLGHLVSNRQKAFFVLPQTHKQNILGESIAVINPTLALASIFGFRRIRRNVSHPLVSIAQGWMGMPLSTFRSFDFHRINIPSWKEALAKGWDMENKTYILAFGEKHLLRYYPENLKVHLNQLKRFWGELWTKGERTGLFLYLAALLIWLFPLLFFFSHPFWAIAGLMLLILFRFFSKIIFQDSWGAMVLHFVGCLIWLGTFIWWATTGLKALQPNRDYQ